jgi:hypothetical protein
MRLELRVDELLSEGEASELVKVGILELIRSGRPYWIL